MNFDALYNPYASRRMSVYARNGMVATSQPLAAQAGLSILQRGGNAIDAAIATAACLTVLEPTSNGIGSDAFALIWTGGKLHGLNASGPAPQSISAKAVRAMGHDAMPRYGFIPVNVPGAPAAWVALSKRFGKLPLTEVLQPAVEYAQCGYPVAPVLGYYWDSAFRSCDHWTDDVFKPWFETFAPSGRAPHIGEIWRSTDLAKTLQLIAETNGDAFYRGVLADQIDHCSKMNDGFLRKEDLYDFQPEWVEPIKVHYRGYDVWEIPPNGQGIVTLLALNILKGFEFSQKETVDTYHKQIEAIKLAFADGRKFITDSRHMRVSVDDLLSNTYAEERRKLIGTKALQPEPGQPPKGGTVYLATADGEGNMVSFIQSNYLGFGSGVVIPGTGIALQNRGCTFSLDPTHHNYLEPGKKTYHTIIPGFLTKGNEPIGPFGVMGGFMQPQGHVQLVMNTIDFGLNPQAALDAPRWQWIEGRTVALERAFPEHIAESLGRTGHNVVWSKDHVSFGRGQIIWRKDDGVLFGGTEPRADGSIVAW